MAAFTEGLRMRGSMDHFGAVVSKVMLNRMHEETKSKRSCKGTRLV